MKLVDASVYISAFLSSDSQHQRAKEQLLSLEDTILLPYVTLSEVLTVLTRKHSKALADVFVEAVLQDARFILLNVPHAIEDLYYWKKVTTELSFADIVLVHLAEKHHAELITYDKDQQKLYQKLTA